MNAGPRPNALAIDISAKTGVPTGLENFRLSEGGGEGGIRTHGTREEYNGFRDRPNRPLWHLSAADTSAAAAHAQLAAAQNAQRVVPIDLIASACNRWCCCCARSVPAFGLVL